MDPIKEAFFKIKEDIQFLKNEILQLKFQSTHQHTKPTHNPESTHQHTNTPTHQPDIYFANREHIPTKYK
ncbi:MAG: hypothetical protein V1889_03900 [archaeon]